jgi:hypothetical protein
VSLLCFSITASPLQTLSLLKNSSFDFSVPRAACCIPGCRNVTSLHGQQDICGSDVTDRMHMLAFHHKHHYSRNVLCRTILYLVPSWARGPQDQTEPKPVGKVLKRDACRIYTREVKIEKYISSRLLLRCRKECTQYLAVGSRLSTVRGRRYGIRRSCVGGQDDVEEMKS